MRPLNILSVVAAAGIGLSLGAPAPRRYALLGADFTANVQVGEAKATALLPAAGHLTGIHWASTTAGTGGAEDRFTFAAQVNGVAACSLEVLCTDEAESSATCDVPLAAGDDLHLTVTASDCSAMPVGVSSATLYFH